MDKFSKVCRGKEGVDVSLGTNSPADYGHLRDRVPRICDGYSENTTNTLDIQQIHERADRVAA